MVRDRWLFSIIQHQSARSVPTPFGVVLFRPGGGLMVRLIERAPSNMEPGGARWLMAARALVSRLRTANPKTRDDILAFIRLEGNEMGLAEPQPVPVIMSAEQILEFLFHRYVRSENRLEDFLRLMGRGHVSAQKTIVFSPSLKNDVHVYRCSGDRAVFVAKAIAADFPTNAMPVRFTQQQVTELPPSHGIQPNPIRRSPLALIENRSEQRPN